MFCIFRLKVIPKNIVGFILLSYLAACSGYTQQTSGTIQAVRSGNVDNAVADLEKNNNSQDKDLLYYLEKGQLLRLKGDLPNSRDSWLSADAMVRHWEDDVRHDPGKLLGELGSVVLNDTTRRYDGRDYEKVLLSTSLAMDHLFPVSYTHLTLPTIYSV